MKVAIVKYNAGNVQSVSFALERLGITPLVTDVHEELLAADKIIFPGVGEAGSAMTYLRQANLEKLMPQFKQPVLGICLGLQLMCRHSEESDTACLGVFPVEVKRFNQGLKVPHMGWNTIHSLKGSLFEGLSEKDFLYYVHSYYAELSDYTIAQTDYGLSYSAALHKDNFYAVQAHPEKSAQAGAKILENFIKRIQ
ncbi:imidazole glycerol phosphate synthase subunit HisH [Cytophagales bacterium LB-30]|uniref:Imidazole glycerol phosphate synthase subunit HisH n=1 Tax=Shiella aurantiaca TaxID=3058365 RepID=A0ABT8F885_9BACT|nr:imidazole glycerol phosphate synthase subunit HisH [Shiella aurantiaca]MDN4166449.1 imidazole glycerol phosphate synthase subunit HisH [Shiella aurantiaca]